MADTAVTIRQLANRSRISLQASPAAIILKTPTQHHPRTYATQTSVGTTASPAQRSRRVTAFNDDGSVPWGQLSPAEKFSRTTQQSVNFTLMIGGAIATIGVFTFLYTDVFSPQSSTNHFNRAVDRIRSDPKCIEILGDENKISAYGEASWNKWRRNRPIASRTETDKLGTERLYMHFNVSGPLNTGVARLFMVRRQDEKQFHYGHLTLEVPGHSKVWLEDGEAATKSKKTPGKFFGVRWS